jgi:hypothetical protein
VYEGKKVFFVIPHEIVREHLVTILSENEYEVYIINDLRVIDTLVNRFPDSIMYINVDGSLTEYEWKEKIRTLIEKYPGLQVGVLSGRISDQTRVNSYIMDAGVSAGVIQLRQGIKECSTIMLRVLEACEARGRRKYLRYKCDSEKKIKLNFDWFGTMKIGSITDISSVGLSCFFEVPLDVAKNQVIPNVQLKLGATLIITDCIVIGSRDDNGTMMYVFLFRPSGGKPVKPKICKFINTSLQRELDKIL